VPRLDQVVQVSSLLRVEEAEGAPRSAGATEVRDDVHIAAGHPEVGGAGFDEAHWGDEVLDLAWVGQPRRSAPGTARPSPAGGRRPAACPVADDDRRVLVAGRRELRHGQFPIGPTVVCGPVGRRWPGSTQATVNAIARSCSVDGSAPAMDGSGRWFVWWCSTGKTRGSSTSKNRETRYENGSAPRCSDTAAGPVRLCRSRR